MTRAARQAAAAADAVLDWLRARDAAAAASGGSVPDAALPEEKTATGAAVTNRAAHGADLQEGQRADATPPDGEDAPARHAAVPRSGFAAGGEGAGDTLRLAHTDWLYHHLDVAGPPEAVRAFREAARGAGVIPWHLDLDRIEEDAFLLLAAPLAPQARTLSAAGARILAEEIRGAVARRHEAALARVGCSVVCPLDLHAVLPVPGEILCLGPDHPQAVQWLWTHWGTTQALRHVFLVPAPPEGARAGVVPGEARLSLRFWSADWTPWRALLALQERWPALRWHLQPRYDAT